PLPPASTIPSTRSLIRSSVNCTSRWGGRFRYPTKHRTGGGVRIAFASMRASTVTAPTAVSNTWRWSVIALLVAGVIIAYVDRSNISVAMVVPEFRALFHLTDAGRGTLN